MHENEFIKWLGSIILVLMTGFGSIMAWVHRALRADHENLEQRVMQIERNLLTKQDLIHLEEKLDSFIRDYYRDKRIKND